MGWLCCGGSATKEKAGDGEKDKATRINGETFRSKVISASLAKFHSVPFDVIVPDRAGAAGARSESGADGDSIADDQLSQGTSTSFAAFDQTMYTVRGDTSMSQLPYRHNTATNNTTFNFDTNLSFTNNFNDVNNDVVRRFLQNVQSIADGGGGGRVNNMLEESMIRHTNPNHNSHISGGSGAPTGSESEANAAPFADGGAGAMTHEDEVYINDGKDLAEKTARLMEVEEVLRQNIFGSWRMNATLIQLALARLVPTLRQRRQPWNNPEAAAVAAAAGQPGRSSKRRRSRAPPKPGRKAVLVIHAQDLDLAQSMTAPSPLAPGGAGLNAVAQPDWELYSPAHAEDSPSNSAAAATPPQSPGGLSDALGRSMSRSRFDPAAAGKKVEHYEMLTLSCRDIGVSSAVQAKVVDDTWEFLADDANTDVLNSGGCLFRFMCGPVNQCDQETLDMIHLFINHSSFADEEKENNTPKINVRDPEDAAKYVCISVKAMYMLPGARLASITPAMLSSKEYQEACQPSQNKLGDCDDPNTFRLTITVIKFIFSLTVMFRVSEITDPDVLFSFKSADGIVPAKAMMLERTKRNVSKVDATAKVRSMLLYYPVNGGLLVNNHTFVMNTSIPKVAAKVLNKFGSQGAAQSAETALLTRKHMAKKYGDSRK